MADRRIDQLTALPTVDTTDLVPIYDISASTTKKSTFSQVKTSLSLVKADVGLSNVDNTSDANKPVSIAQQAEISNTSIINALIFG